MPFVNAAARQEKLETFKPYEHTEKAGFSEVFGVSFDRVIDEDLSISSALNREGWNTRKSLIDEMISSGEISDPAKYRTNHGRMPTLDYDKIARELENPDIKTDEQLTEERNQVLAERREYADDVVSRGSGMAQFLGSMSAYMLDPFNLLSVGVAAPATTLRATTTLGRVALTAKNTALTEGAVELGIQGLVSQHKNDIDSPYTAADALANIGMAAGGGAVLGGVAGGLAAWLSRVDKYAESLPQTDEVVTARNYLQRQQATLEARPEGVDPSLSPQEQLQMDLDFLNESAARAQRYDLANKRPEDYELPETEQIKKPPVAAASPREQELLTAQGIADDYNADMAAFDGLEDARILVDDELVDARALVDVANEQIQGLDSVLRCVYG